MLRIVAIALVVGIAVGCGGSSLDASKDPVLKDVTRPTIYQAAKAGDLETVKKIISNTMSNEWDPGRPDSTGTLPLNYAAQGGNVEIIKLMVQNGAGVNRKDFAGDTPLASAQKAGNTAAVDALKKLGAKE